MGKDKDLQVKAGFQTAEIMKSLIPMQTVTKELITWVKDTVCMCITDYHGFGIYDRTHEETDFLFVAACQDDVMNIIIYRKLTFHENIMKSCRVCQSYPETIMHILSAWPIYAVSLYIDIH